MSEARLTIEEALPAYLAAFKPTASVETMARTLWPRFFKYCQSLGLVRVAELRVEHVESFRQALCWEPGPKGRIYAPHTIAMVLRLVRHVLRWAHKEGFLAADPTAGLVLPRLPVAERRQLTAVQLEQLLGAIDTSHPIGLRDAAVLAVMTEARLPCHHLLALNLSDAVGLCLSASSRRLLDAYLAEARSLWAPSPRQPALFLNRYGTRIEAQTVRKSMEQAAKSIGLAGVTLRVLSRGTGPT